MKSTEFKTSLEKMSVQQLLEKLDVLRKELFGLRLSVSTSHVKNYAQFRQYRNNIARVLTQLGQKQKQVNSK